VSKRLLSKRSGRLLAFQPAAFRVQRDRQGIQ
jgi:hypothetical protein